ncbi:hypothetical protein ASF44_14610 [Pseudorhodoferax sp. Leaf274]|nr:hypothetical protein ASF44_14610 [Pseudorhodoferax sp. Leaf274]
MFGVQINQQALPRRVGSQPAKHHHQLSFWARQVGKVEQLSGLFAQPEIARAELKQLACAHEHFR